MKTSSKIISLLLSAVLMLSLPFNSAFVALADETNIESGTCPSSSGSLTYVLDANGTLTISGSGRMSNFYNTDNGRAPWYNNRGSIKKVVLQPGVINIGSSAFYNCKQITEVDFGTIDTIGTYAFQYCEALDSAVLPESCTYIWNNAFDSCTSLRKAYIPGISIAGNAVSAYTFKDCTSLTVVKLGQGVKYLTQTAFSGCSNLKTIISNTVSTSNYTVLPFDTQTNSCSGVCSDNTYSSTKLTWNYEMENEKLWFTGSGDIKYYSQGERPWDMFFGVIKKVDFSNTDGKCSTTSDSFKDFASIETMDLTNIYLIGWRSFGDCTGITALNFDSTLTEIWDWAFERCYGIDHITFKNGSSPLHIRQHAFYQCKNTTYWLNFPSNLSRIDEGAFKGTKFNYITFTNTGKIEIGDNAFGTTDRDFYVRFMTPDATDIGVYDYVQEMRDKYRYNWFCYCKNGNHIFESSTVQPTCIKDGYNRYGCKYCMQNEYKSNYVAKLGHKYQIKSTDGTDVQYQCSVCGEDSYYLSYAELCDVFKPAISTVAGENKFIQTNYSAKVDLNYDGVINAKDFAIMRKSVSNVDTTNKETTIDTSRTYQEIEGFGASACWWSQEVGEWENASEIMEMLYSEENGIGLDIYRYNLGAGSQDQNDTGLYNRGARTYCFMKEDGSYDWNSDPGAMNCLDLAVQFNPNVKVTLFSNSAPYFMTKNGKTYSTQGSDTSNLDSANYQAFADFTVNCAEHFIDEGYNVTEVSPINEPEWDWKAWYNGDGSQSHGQEGCHFEWNEALNFYNNYMVPTLNRSSKLNGRVDLSVWECAQLNHPWLFTNFIDNLFSSKDYDTIDNRGRKSGNGFAGANSNIRSYTNYLATHSYWCSEDDRRTVAQKLGSEFYGQKVKSTEYCQMTNDINTGVLGHIQNEGSTNGMTIDYGIAMADIMYQDLTSLNAVEWDWWTACAKGVYTDNLLLINANNHSDVQTSKRYWCMGNFSKFVNPGARRIQVDVASGFAQNLHTNRTYHWTFHDDNNNISNEGVDKNNYIEQLAFLNTDGTVAIIFINCSDTIEHTRINGGNYSKFSTYVTSELMDLKNLQNGRTSSDAICIPAHSVTTIVLSN